MHNHASGREAGQQHDPKVTRCKARPDQPKSVRIVLATLFYASPHHARRSFGTASRCAPPRTATRLHQDLPVYLCTWLAEVAVPCQLALLELQTC
jgi:hypothetical protein